MNAARDPAGPTVQGNADGRGRHGDPGHDAGADRRAASHQDHEHHGHGRDHDDHDDDHGHGSGSGSGSGSGNGNGNGNGHGHGHGHGHHGHSHAPTDPADFSRAFGIGIALNTLFLAVEAFYGWKVDSLALLADAGHNLSDVAGLAVAWAGARAAGVAPSARYTYGRKRASILAAFANAVLLLLAMGSLAWEAIARLHAPQPTAGVTLIVVAGLGIVVNAGTAMLFLRGRHGDLNVRGAFLHMAADALVSAGVVATGALALAFGWNWLDPVASLAIAVVIVLGTWGLLRQSVRLMFDGVPEGIDLHAVRRELEALPGVDRVHDLHVWAAGTTETVLTAHLVMPGGAPGDAFYQSATERLRARFAIGHVTLQVVAQPFAALCGEPARLPGAGGAPGPGGLAPVPGGPI